MADLPVVVTQAGAQPTPPATLLARLLAAVAAQNPGYTATLPGSLIEDISSTDVAALAVCDAAVVETINSLTPFGANNFLLNQLGGIYGVIPGLPTATSVFVVFAGSPGFVVPQGFVVGDGAHQYALVDGGVVLSGGASLPLFAVADLGGSWPVPRNTVTTLATSFPAGLLTGVTNPAAGTPGSASPETSASFRSRVLQAGLAVAQGMSTMLKTRLTQVPGVQPRLVSVRNSAPGQWEVLAGGGDPYAVAYAIYASLFDVSSLVGSTLLVTGVSQASPGVVTTRTNHNYATGQVVNVAGVVMPGFPNNVPLTATVVSPTQFSIGVSTIGFGAYASGGVVTPNLINVNVSINDYPDTYVIPFVNPPPQAVTMVVTWNTNSPNFVSPASVSALAAPALVAYVNSIPVGAPINVDVMVGVFQAAVASILPPALLTRLIFAVAVNGVTTAVTAGTVIIPSDPESYFSATPAAAVVVQG